MLVYNSALHPPMGGSFKRTHSACDLASLVMVPILTGLQDTFSASVPRIAPGELKFENVRMSADDRTHLQFLVMELRKHSGSGSRFAEVKKSLPTCRRRSQALQTNLSRFCVNRHPTLQ